MNAKVSLTLAEGRVRRIQANEYVCFQSEKESGSEGELRLCLSDPQLYLQLT